MNTVNEVNWMKLGKTTLKYLKYIITFYKEHKDEIKTVVELATKVMQKQKDPGVKDIPDTATLTEFDLAKIKDTAVFMMKFINFYLKHKDVVTAVASKNPKTKSAIGLLNKILEKIPVDELNKTLKTA